MWSCLETSLGVAYIVRAIPRTGPIIAAGVGRAKRVAKGREQAIPAYSSRYPTDLARSWLSSPSAA
jgi:hypothetical protein